MKNNDLAGGVGGYILSGIGGLNFGGWFTIKGKPKVMKVGDWSSSNAGGASLRGSSLVTRTADGVQSVNTTVSTGVSIKEAFEQNAPTEKHTSVDMTSFNIDTINFTKKEVITSETPVNFSGTESEVNSKIDSLNKKNTYEKAEYDAWTKTLNQDSNN